MFLSYHSPKSMSINEQPNNRTLVHILLTVPDPKVVNLSSKASIYAAFRAFLFGKNIKNTLDN